MQSIRMRWCCQYVAQPSSTHEFVIHTKVFPLPGTSGGTGHPVECFSKRDSALKNWIALMVPQILVKTSGGQCLACFGPVRAPNSKLFSSPVGPGEVIIQSDGCWPPSQTLDVKTLKKSLLQIEASCRPIVSPTRDSGYSNIQSISRAPTGFDPAIGPGFFNCRIS